MNGLRRDRFFPSASYIVERADDHTKYKMDFADGSGTMTAYRVMPGITLVFNDFATFCNFPDEIRCPGIVEINHCRKGRFECVMSDGRTVSLGPQDFSLSDMNHPPKMSAFTFGEYKGISLIVETTLAQRSLSVMLGSDVLSLSELFKGIFAEQSLLLLRADIKIQHIFSEMYDAPSSVRNLYFRLKAAELFLFLSCRRSDESAASSTYVNRSLSLRIRDIERVMTEDLRTHMTVSELAARYRLSETTITKNFAKLFGEPPYTYLKRRRMETAAYMLETTELTITEIAASVGYQNASKFSCAFSSVYGVSPSDYKKGVRLE